MPRAYPRVEHMKGASVRRALALPANIRLTRIVTTTLSITTFSIKTFCITTLSVMSLFVTLSINDTQLK
jgi:hypothetical protein